MARPHFHEELDEIELQLLTLGELAGNAVGNAVEAVVEHDDDQAERVVAGDDEIDRIYLGSTTASCRSSPSRRRSPRTCGSSR